MTSLSYSTKSRVWRERRGRWKADLKMPSTERRIHLTRISATTRRHLRRQWLIAALLVGGGIIATIIDVGVRAWIAFHDIVVKGNTTPAVVTSGISPDIIFLIITVAGLLLSIATAIEALWRRLRLAQ